jgi:hypothetical protein
VLPTQLDDAGAFNRNVVRAHQELANVPGTAGATFQRVAECLARDLKASDEDTTEINLHKPE